ncbi:MAG TPA: glucosidase [Verrucomicrobiae bacterium]|nr:glucosidase [Verrucomicrobiae bacterium]
METTESKRLTEANAHKARWKLWGPYLSERQWGTVREDYSPNGTAWEYFPHDHARSRAYRWGEDGIAGISDDQCRLCLSLALWNGQDPILKERFFGLTNSEGNHGEDVKELYYHLDATPTHSYLKMLYKYPQRAFPYCDLVEENARRKRDAALPEYELLDTGIFEDDRYWDVFVEYAKAAPDDILMRVTAHNRGPEEATIHLLPQLWFRNTWSWKPNSARPILYAQSGCIVAQDAEVGTYEFHPDELLLHMQQKVAQSPRLLFCENDTNPRRHYDQSDASGFFKDAFHEYIVGGNHDVVNPTQTGTKAGVLHKLTVGAGKSAQIRLRLVGQASRLSQTSNNGKSQRQARRPSYFENFDSLFTQRIEEADAFYAELQKDITDADARNVQRQALAGMIWSKQFFYYDVAEWLKGDPACPPPPAERRRGRNADWQHLNNADIISMPDKWEYPWYAAWDLAFHCIPLALVDAEFAKHQLVLLTREWYMHPNGQLPAYEWAFGDVNPPVHAWAAWRVFKMDRKQRRETAPNDKGDLAFLERVFHKLMLNFTWWVNRKDAQGRNIFQGGFLGLDNIGVFDRSAPLPTGGFINQADGTSWMAMYCLNLMRIALELARHNKVYEDIATKFFEHFLQIAAAINTEEDGLGLWDHEDEFYYDQLRTPGGREIPLKVRSMVGLIPLFAVEVLEPELLAELPAFTKRLEWFLENRPELAKLVSRWKECGDCERHLLSLLRGHRMKCLLRRMLDETEFLSDYGIRALSKVHEREPYRLQIQGMMHEVAYWPAESMSGVFGGNSNWRGPIWMPVNFLLIESLQKFHHYYGDDFKIECPTRSGNFITIKQAAEEVSRRLTRLFLKGADGQRPVLKYHPKLATDPHFKDYVLFHEYFHGDTGRGVGASHQTGWTGLIAKLLMPRRATRQATSARVRHNHVLKRPKRETAAV